jgi:LL-H family phage holin
MEELVMNVLIAIATLVGAYIAFYASKYFKMMENDKQWKLISHIATTVVLAVQQQFESEPGQERLRIATVRLSEALDKYGIKLTDMQIRSVIEAAYREMKQWHNFEEEVVG